MLENMNKEQSAHSQPLNTIEEDNASFVSVKSGQSSKLSELSVLTICSSDVPESISTTINDETIKENKEIQELCSKCIQKFERVPASHFCKKCKPCGRYFCKNCLQGHNEWKKHKKIISLSALKSKPSESPRIIGINKPSISSSKKENIDSWLEKHPETFSTTDESMYSTTTYEESENPYHSIGRRDKEITAHLLENTTNTISEHEEGESELVYQNIDRRREEHHSQSYYTLDEFRTFHDYRDLDSYEDTILPSSEGSEINISNYPYNSGILSGNETMAINLETGNMMYPNQRIYEVHQHENYVISHSFDLDHFNPEEETYEDYCVRKHGITVVDASIKESDHISSIYTPGRSDDRPTRRRKFSEKCTIM